MRTTAIAFLTLVLTGADLTAQRRDQSGFWYVVGVAPGWARVTCELCAGRRETGMSALVGIGGSSGRALRVGGELAGWRDRDGNVSQTLLSVGGTVYWYPSTRRRVYLRGGVALLMHRVSDGTDVVSSTGIGPQLGMGYEHAASPRWVVAPFAHYAVGIFGGDVQFNGGQAAGSARVSFLQVGVSLSHRSR